MTRLAVVVVLVGVTDLSFALDSIGAVLALSHAPLLFVTSQAASMLLLRPLYFALAATMASVGGLDQALPLSRLHFDPNPISQPDFDPSVSPNLNCQLHTPAPNPDLDSTLQPPTSATNPAPTLMDGHKQALALVLVLIGGKALLEASGVEVPLSSFVGALCAVRALVGVWLCYRGRGAEALLQRPLTKLTPSGASREVLASRLEADDE